jgi:hypothetical protein
MSDFLANIAARHLELTPLLQPALVSLFEPEVKSARPVVPIDEQIEVDQTRPPVATPEEQPRHEVHFAEHPANAQNTFAPTREIPATTERTLERVIEHVERDSPNRLQPLPAWPTQSVVIHEQTLRSDPVERVLEKTERVVSQQIREVLHDSDETPSGVPPNLESSHRSNPIYGPSVPREQHSTAHVTAPLSPAVVRLASVLPPVLPKTPERVQGEARAEAEVAPVVRVTIGRVEVRAIMPSSAAPREVKAFTGLLHPLDEFLKKGSRRTR